MFFAFFSDREIPENLWIPVWETEAFVQAHLMVELEDPKDWDRLRRLSRTELADLLKTEIRANGFGFLSKILATGVSSEWVDAYLEYECEAILDFARRITPTSDGVRPMMPKKKRFLDCLKRSEPFHAHIVARGHAAQEARTAMNREKAAESRSTT